MVRTGIMVMVLPAVYTLISGTYSAISSKALYKWNTEGINGISNKFQKPYFMTMMMFVGEALCLFYKLVVDWQASRKKHFVMSQSVMDGTDSLTNGNNNNADSPQHANGTLSAPLLENGRTSVSSEAANKPHLGVFVILTLFDLTASTLNGVGLIWVSASANQMLRGSMIFFTGVFSVLIFKKKFESETVGWYWCCYAWSYTGWCSRNVTPIK